MGVINDILGVVDTAVDSVAADGFAQSAGSVGGVITAGSAVLVILLGINIVAQIRPMSFGSFFAFGIKIALVGIFAQSWADFQIIYNIANDVPDNIGASILGLTGVASEGGLYNALDAMVSQVTAYGDSIGDNAGWVFGAVLGATVFVLAGIFAAIAAGIIAYAKIVFTLLIVVAPFAIIASLFKPTMSIFEAWMRFTIGHAFMPIAAAGAAGIVVAIATEIASGGPDPDNVETLSLIFPFIVVLFLSAGIMMAVPSIAMGLSGTIGIASNAVGLTNLAKQGLIKGGKAGGAALTKSAGAGMQIAQNKFGGGGGGSPSVPARSNPSSTLAATNSLRK